MVTGSLEEELGVRGEKDNFFEELSAQGQC